MKKSYIIFIIPFLIVPSCSIDEDFSSVVSSIEENSSVFVDWNEPTYIWNSDYTTITASRTDKNNANNKEEETVDVSYRVVTNPTCTEDGLGRYTSNSFTNSAFSVQTHDVTINKLGHNYGEVTYLWLNDHSKVTASRTCSHNHDHKEEETVTTSNNVTTNPSCLNEGVRTYTSSSFTNSAFSVQTYNESIPTITHNDPVVYEYQSIDDDNHRKTCPICSDSALEVHLYGNLIIDEYAVGANPGTGHYVCSDCTHVKYVEHSQHGLEF